MTAFTASAPGKVILLGEHAVVYGEPALAVPLFNIQARAIVRAVPRGNPGEMLIQAPDIELEAFFSDLDSHHPLKVALLAVLEHLEMTSPPACVLNISSTIPIASGLGSGAAVTCAVVRAFSAFLGQRLTDDQVSQLTYQAEKIHHGTPSGIDNTVICRRQPIYFQAGKPVEPLRIPHPFFMVIGSTGIPSPTGEVVSMVRRAREKNPARYNSLFASIGKIVKSARTAIEDGGLNELGELMNTNQSLLEDMGVSSPELENLITAARNGGAPGAKLSGGGKGGNMIALVEEDQAQEISSVLLRAGAVETMITRVTGWEAV